MIIRRAILLAVLLLLPVICSTPALAQQHIIIAKSENRLYLYDGEQLIKQYPAMLGQSRGSKIRQGDKKTPIGVYRIMSKSRSQFRMFLALNYPGPHDAVRGLQNHLITKAQYEEIIEAHRRNMMPPQGTRLGGAIGIHGVDKKRAVMEKVDAGVNWTAGCISLPTWAIDDLTARVEAGTEVLILD